MASIKLHRSSRDLELYYWNLMEEFKVLQRVVTAPALTINNSEFYLHMMLRINRDSFLKHR